MISPGIGEMSMAEQAMELALETPSVYSDDTLSPFRDLGIQGLSDEQLGEMFEAKQVLDIGSGSEGIARRLFKIFGDSQLAPRVVNLNPQLGRRFYKEIALTRIASAMTLEGEDVEAYMKQRTSCVAVIQDLPFEDGMFDIQLSTWGFPKCLFDCQSDYFIYDVDRDAHAMQGYTEIVRTQAIGGVALLAPIVGRHETDITESHLEKAAGVAAFNYEFKPRSDISSVLKIQRLEPSSK